MGMFKLRSLTLCLSQPAWVLIFRSDNFYSMFVPSLPSSNQSPLTRPTYRPVSSVWTGDLTYLPLIQSTVTTGGTERRESRDINPWVRLTSCYSVFSKWPDLALISLFTRTAHKNSNDDGEEANDHLITVQWILLFQAHHYCWFPGGRSIKTTSLDWFLVGRIKFVCTDR